METFKVLFWLAVLQSKSGKRNTKWITLKVEVFIDEKQLSVACAERWSSNALELHDGLIINLE